MRKKLFPFIVFLFFGVFNTIVHVVLIEMSSKYSVETYQIGYILTIVNIVNSAIVYYNGMIIDKINIKKEAILGLLISIIGIISIVNSNTLILFAMSYLLYTIGSALIFSLSNYLGIVLFEEEERASKYTLINLIYCVGAFVTPSIIAFLLDKGFKWEHVYALTIIFLVLSFFTIFDQKINIKVEKVEENNGEKPKGTAKTYYTALALMFYEISEISLCVWFVTYIRETLLLDSKIASYTLSLFWVFMAIGRLLASVLLKKMSSKNYIFIFLSITMITFFAFLNVHDKNLILILGSLLGFGYSGLFPTIVSFGTQQKNIQTSKVMSFILTCGTIGLMLANPISSTFVKLAGIRNALYISLSFLLLVFGLIFLASLEDKKLTTS